MKKLLFILITLILFSCISVKAPAVSLGMSTKEFENNTKNREIVSMEQDLIIYKVIYGYSAEKCKFYYFIDDKLIKMDEGITPLKRYQIEHIIN
ncbi:hypothetical protein [Thalassobellus suaedae]|uniref:Uncharacterized protein n=1 Tax=Thalassobellus suaedae TaxID=3074124 RepID=A0ABY9XWL6_9FLAO|nr:hypothetical protein RHP51_04800 [Flavobacteriaceae bacterium HL-DH14]